MTDEILYLVPNKENFRLTLRAIKLWAKRKWIQNISDTFTTSFSTLTSCYFIHEFFSMYFWHMNTGLSSVLPIKNSCYNLKYKCPQKKTSTFILTFSRCSEFSVFFLNITYFLFVNPIISIHDGFIIVCIDVFRHDLRVNSGELGPEVTQGLPFRHAQHSGRFSAQAHSQQQQIRCISQTRGGAAGCSRQRQCWGRFLEAGERRTDLLYTWCIKETRKWNHVQTLTVTWAIVTPKSEDVFHSFPIHLPLLVSPIPTAHPWMARIAVTLLHVGVRILLDG